MRRERDTGLPLMVMCACRSHTSSYVSGAPLPGDVSGWAARRTYANCGLEVDSGVTATFKQHWYSVGAASAVRHPHVPVSVRAMLGGGKADVVHGRLR
jgi:hypothetical protein